MRLLLLALLCLPALATVPRPGDPVHLRAQIWRFGTHVQVEVVNSTDLDVRCGGTVHIHTRRGRFQTEYFNETLYRGQARRATYRLWDFQDEVTYVSEFINCREI